MNEAIKTCLYIAKQIRDSGSTMYMIQVDGERSPVIWDGREDLREFLEELLEGQFEIELRWHENPARIFITWKELTWTGHFTGR